MVLRLYYLQANYAELLISNPGQEFLRSILSPSPIFAHAERGKNMVSQRGTNSLGYILWSQGHLFSG
jgi:hypothetical protein